MLKKYMNDYLWFVFGSVIYAVAITLFISPNEISPGGITGIATILNYLLGLPTGFTVFILNIPILILGYCKCGKGMIINTTVVTVITSFALTVTENLFSTFKMDKIIASIFGGILLGFSISIIMRHGATTGGVDIIAKIINRKYRHITIGKIILMTDVAVVLLAVLAYGKLESALYSVVTMFSSSKVMDYMLYGSDRGKLVYIITDKPGEVASTLVKDLARGVTILDVTGGYTGEKRKMLMCSVRPYEVSALYSIIEEFDPKAFITVTEAGEIIGEGFKRFD